MSTLAYFIAASAALTIAPGPDNLFVMTQGIARGKKAAIVTALGMCSGVSVHTVAAALGISAIFHSSIAAFNTLKYAGAAYLLYLAFRTLKERSSVRVTNADGRPAAALFKRGFLMNVLNPKVAMFFLAFLPQFASQQTGNFATEMLFLGFVFMVQAIVIFCTIAWFAGATGQYLLKRPKVAAYLDWLTAGIFISLGIRLAMASR